MLCVWKPSSMSTKYRIWDGLHLWSLWHLIFTTTVQRGMMDYIIHSCTVGTYGVSMFITRKILYNSANSKLKNPYNFKKIKKLFCIKYLSSKHLFRPQGAVIPVGFNWILWHRWKCKKMGSWIKCKYAIFSLEMSVKGKKWSVKFNPSVWHKTFHTVKKLDLR